MKHLPLLAILVGYAVCQNCGVMNPNGKQSARFRRDIDTGIQKRIVGGRNTVPGELPFQVRLFLRLKDTDTSGFACGASVISGRCILTAAHCFFDCSKTGDNRNLTNAIATFGAYNLANKDQRANLQAYKSDFRVHNGYQPCSNNLKNDIAVIRFNMDIPMGMTSTGYKSVGTICRATSNDFTNANVSGWGAIYGSGPSSNILKIADMVKKQPCGFAIDSSQVCAVSPSNQRNNGCNGDSGGPFFSVINNRAQQIGIVSYGSQGCTPGTANVYTSVSYFASWINTNCGI